MHFDLLNQYIEPIATRTVRELTGEVTQRDADDRAEYLPTSMSKRRCYEIFCLTMGVRIRVNSKGTVWSKRHLASVEEAGSNLAVPKIPSWRSYLEYWKKHYSYIRVSRPSEDVCNYCYAFRNIYKALSPRRRQRHKDVALSQLLDPSSSTVASDSLQESRICIEVEADSMTFEREQKIQEATVHVQMARTQRELVNRKIALARETSDDDHSDRTYTLIVDYGQNMELPMFGHEQPGDTYYYSPLTIYNLGVVDVSHPEGDHLYCHIYKEGDGRKGGNNVASLLMKTLRMLSLLQLTAGKELNVVFDNCGGQTNKNNFVLLLVRYLVEMGYFQHVNFIFLVVGHTKNAADQLFNA